MSATAIIERYEQSAVPATPAGPARAAAPTLVPAPAREDDPVAAFLSDERLQGELLDLLERGLRPREAATACGVPVAVLKGAVGADPDFKRRFHRARLSVKLKHLDNIHHIREGNGWRVSAWYLSSAYPEEFGPPPGRRGGNGPRAARAGSHARTAADSAEWQGDPPPIKASASADLISEKGAEIEPQRFAAGAGLPAPNATAGAADELDDPDDDHDGPAMDPPAGMPEPGVMDGRIVPPPACTVVDGVVRPDGPAPGDETIFADYDQAMYHLLANEFGAARVAAAQLRPVRCTGAYFDKKILWKRTVGPRELIRRFGTENVRRYVWTGASFEQVYPLPPGDEDPP